MFPYEKEKEEIQKKIEKHEGRNMFLSWLIAFILTILFLWLCSSCSTHRCATYGYKKTYVNGKTTYYDRKPKH